MPGGRKNNSSAFLRADEVGGGEGGGGREPLELKKTIKHPRVEEHAELCRETMYGEIRRDPRAGVRGTTDVFQYPPISAF